MSSNLPRSYWPARQRRLGPTSSTKVRRVPGKRHGEPKMFKRDGCSLNCLPPAAAGVANTTPKAAAMADCFVIPRVDRYERQTGAGLGTPCCRPPVRKNAEEYRRALTCVQSRRGPIPALNAFGFQAAIRAVRPMMVVWWLRVALLLLLLWPKPAVAIVDLTLYGGAFVSSSIIAHAEV